MAFRLIGGGPPASKRDRSICAWRARNPGYSLPVSTIAIDIRPARTQDAPAIARVHDGAWRNAYRGIIPGSHLERMISRRGADWWRQAIGRGSRILVLTVEGRAAAYASVGRNRAPALLSGGEIYELYVDPDYQGIGLGRRLFDTARCELQSRDLKGVAVWALADNEQAGGFYRHLGGRASARGTERFGEVTLDKLAFTWA
jgi:ribosomal protein S18 acetylase RimI-like enzyme